MQPLTAISPIDGRYRDKVENLSNYFSESARIELVKQTGAEIRDNGFTQDVYVAPYKGDRAVSYTHLDVYKRQIHGNVMTMAI